MTYKSRQKAWETGGGRLGGASKINRMQPSGHHFQVKEGHAETHTYHCVSGSLAPLLVQRGGGNEAAVTSWAPISSLKGDLVTTMREALHKDQEATACVCVNSSPTEPKELPRTLKI